MTEPPPHGPGYPSPWPGPPVPPTAQPGRGLRTPWLIALLVVLISVPATVVAVIVALALVGDPGTSDAGSDKPAPGVAATPGTADAETPSDIPAAFVGNWTGKINTDSFPGITVIARLGITDKPVDGVVASGTFMAAGVVCSGRFSLIERTDTVLRLQAGKADQPDCPSSVNLQTEVELRPDGTLLYRESSEFGRATGVLRRV